MSAKFFDNDKLYLQWIAENANGFVLNINSDNDPNYRVIHSANCYSVTEYQSDKLEGAFAQRGFRKVCANSFQEIIDWIRSNGGGYLKSHGGRSGCNISTPIPLPIEISSANQIGNNFPDEAFPSKVFIEGAQKKVEVNKYERDLNARRICIEKWGVRCSVCNFDFQERYGELGKDFIHVHHLKPLSEIGKNYELDPEKDLRPVCPNCHAMLHRHTPSIPIDELKILLR